MNNVHVILGNPEEVAATTNLLVGIAKTAMADHVWTRRDHVSLAELGSALRNIGIEASGATSLHLGEMDPLQIIPTALSKTMVTAITELVADGVIAHYNLAPTPVGRKRPFGVPSAFRPGPQMPQRGYGNSTFSHQMLALLEGELTA